MANASKNHIHFAGTSQVYEFNAAAPPASTVPPSALAPAQTPTVQTAAQQPQTSKPVELADVVNLFQAGQASLAQSMMQMQAQSLGQVQTAMAQQQAAQQQAMMQQQAMLQEQVKLMGTMLQNVLQTVQQQPQAQPVLPPTTAQPQPPSRQQAPQPLATSSVPTQAPLMRNLVASAAQQGSGTYGGYRSILRDADADFNCAEATRAPFVRPPEPYPFKGEIQDWPRFKDEWKLYCEQMLPDDIQRMRLLKRLLDGPAKELAAYLRDTSQDYHVLMDTLAQTYDQPEAILQHLNTQLRNIARPRRETAKEMREFYNKLNAVCRQLRNAECDVNHRLYLEQVIEKLPQECLKELRKVQLDTAPNRFNTEFVLERIGRYVLDLEFIQRATGSQAVTFSDQHPHKIDPNNGRRVHVTQKADLEEDDSATTTSEVPSNKMDPSLAVKVESGGTLNYNIFKGAPGGTPRTPSGRVPPRGRHDSDRPVRAKQARQQRRPCLFCASSSHVSARCQNYATLEARKERLRKLDRCQRCVAERNGKAHECIKKKVPCNHCGDKCHHKVLCPTYLQDKVPTGNKLYNKQARPERVMALQRDQEQSEGDSCVSSDSDYNDTEDDASSGDEFDKPSSSSVHTVTTADHTVMNATSCDRTLLMTTVVDVSHPEAPNQRYSCPVFFDQGSTTTLMTKDLVRKLNLPIKEEKVATFHGFGDNGEGKQVPCWTVDLDIHLQAGGRLRLTAEAVDSFCSPMTAVAQPRDVVTRVLRQPNMAPQATIITPQILIGSDYLGEFDVIRRKKKLPNGFFVYDSLVGPLLSGKGKVSWKKGEQDRPQFNMVYRITVDPRPQALHKLNIVEQDQLLQATEKMWKTEAIGIESPEAPKAEENERVLKQFLETLVQLADGRYEVAFPFKEEILKDLKDGIAPTSILPHNYQAAFARLSSVWKSYLNDNPQVCEAYAKGFAEQLARGIIEECSGELDSEGLTHYLAHHPVFREDKPTKLRIVFDGSARSKPGARCLNDCLLTGPSLLESLIGILLRSRIAPLLVIGDIEKAFLQISIRPQDRNVTRFLWLKDPSKRPSPDNLVVYRYCRVPFGLNASPFLLLATVQAHLNKLNSPLTEEIKANSYSDNVFLYAQSTEDAVEKYKEAKGTFSKAQMNVREFISNCPDFNKAVPEADRAKETKEKTLGHQWCSQRDVWTFTLPDPTPYKLNQSVDHKLNITGSTDPELILREDKNDHQVMLCRKVKKAKFLTKRLMLSVIHSLWDPLGLLAPVTLQARLMYQSLFDTNLGWDEQVPEGKVHMWEDVTSSWANAQFEVSRFLFHGGRPSSVQLHVFVDASDDAYGAVAYLRVVPETGSTYCVLLFGKNRVADRKVKLSIPRKELLAAIVGCRVIAFLRKEMLPELQRQYKLDSIPTYLWGDNQGVLYWIKDSDHAYGRFVQNRLEEIRRTADTEFRYVPTKDNPADVLSRGATVDELKSHNLWWTASPWLKEEEKLWPSQPSSFQPFSEEILGLDAKPPKEIMSFALTQAQQQDLPMSYALQQARPTDLFDDIRRTLKPATMTYPRIRRVMVNVLRFVSGRLKAIGREPRLPFLKPFTSAGAEEYSGKSEGYLYLMRYNAAELALAWNTQLIKPPTQNQRIQFNIAEGPDGLLRCNGRLGNSGLPRNTINPIWLPEKTRLAKCLVHTIHVLQAHASIETTLASLRRRFWLVKGRRNVKMVIHRNCTACRLAHGQAFRIPEYANLPAERHRKSRPFTHIGLDLFGPYQVRLGLKSPVEQDQQQAQPRRGRKPQRRVKEAPSDLQKVWGVIFTCMSVRAVHLEVVHSLSAEHLWQAFDRFMSRRGQPSSVTSDNAPSIILVNRTIDAMFKQALDDDAMRGYFLRQGIEWHYIVPESPWQGGFYERLIRSVKRCLSSAMGRSHLHFSHFTQLLARVENTLNCRPLTHQSVGDIDTVPLRPIDFLQPLADPGNMDIQPEPEDEDEDYEERTPPERQLLKLVGKQQAQLVRFWDRWRAEYLPSLRETQRALKQSGRVDRVPEVGEFVLVDDDEPLPRSHWKFARIMELIPGRDGTIRHVRLKFPGGAEAERAVHQLCPFELMLHSEEEAATQHTH